MSVDVEESAKTHPVMSLLKDEAEENMDSMFTTEATGQLLMS